MLSRQLTKSAAALAAVVALSLTAAIAQAGPLVAPAPGPSAFGVQRIAGNACGPGQRQGMNGVCHSDAWFTRRAYCPRGWHLGPAGRRCRPN